MSDARRAADMRLANGEITLEQHEAIVSRLDGSTAPAQRPSDKPISPPSDIPSDDKIGKYSGVGIVLLLAGVALIYARSNWLTQCRADPTYVASTCRLGTGGGLLAGCLILAGIGLLLMGYAMYKDREKALKKS